MIYLTADHHFCHTNIIRFCNRPFASVGEMNTTMVTNWNNVVEPKDTVYVLGDFGIGSRERLQEILDALNGYKTLIVGSHDSISEKLKGWVKVTPMLEIKAENHYITLCHYCLRVWPRSHYNTYMAYGHSHGCLSPIGKSMDVGVDSNNFTPVSITNFIKLMASRPDNPNLVK